MTEIFLGVGTGDVWNKLSDNGGAAAAIKKSYTLYALETSMDAVGLRKVNPDKTFLLKKDYAELIKIGKKQGFCVSYISNYPDGHMASALELANLSKMVIISKPIDTNVQFLLTMKGQKEYYDHFLDKVLVHDHYIVKPAISILKEIIPYLHSKHGFLRSIQLYLVEKDSAESKEPWRLEALRCGALFDLAVHLISILFEIVPEGVRWDGTAGEYVRVKRTVDIDSIVCCTGRDAMSLIGYSKIIQNRMAETAGIIELKLRETICLNGKVTSELVVPVLIVVGKGIPAYQDAKRDMKSIVLNFSSETNIVVDIDSCQFSGVENSIIQTACQKVKIDTRRRGLNLPLTKAAQEDFNPLTVKKYFQDPLLAFETVKILNDAIHKSSDEPIGIPKNWTCLELMNRFLRSKQILEMECAK